MKQLLTIFTIAFTLTGSLQADNTPGIESSDDCNKKEATKQTDLSDVKPDNGLVSSVVMTNITDLNLGSISNP